MQDSQCHKIFTGLEARLTSESCLFIDHIIMQNILMKEVALFKYLNYVKCTSKSSVDAHVVRTATRPMLFT